MVSPLLLLVSMTLLAVGHGYPADGESKKSEADTRVGLERPHTNAPPQVSETDLDAALGELFGNSQLAGNGEGSPEPQDYNSPPENQEGYNPQPDNQEGYNPQPDNQGGYNPPPENQGGYNPQPDNQGGYNPPPENQGGFNSLPGNQGGCNQLPDNQGGYKPPGVNEGGFSQNPSDNTVTDYPRPPPSKNPLSSDCRCVQYYLCTDNNTFNEDGVGLIDIRIKEDECSNYLETCCGGQYITETPVEPKPKPRKNHCGNRNLEGLGFRITGDSENEAQYGEFPWMIAVIQPVESSSNPGKTTNVYQCGGSLIHPQAVLTGAHCVSGKSNLLIRAGEWDTQTKNELYPTQDRKVREVIIHEQFNNGSLANDVALLILENPVDMSTDNVGLICMPQEGENMDGRDCIASGWGKDHFGKEGKYQVILKRVEVPTVPRVLCLDALRQTRLGQYFKLHESFICAGGVLGRDTCKGDGGSPLVCPSKDNPDVYVQAGIVAWGIGCGTETPAVYGNVPRFTNWIYNKLQIQGISLDSE